MRFTFIDAAKEEFPVQRLCKVLEVSQSGYFAWRSRPASRRQRDDLVLLAHVRSAFALSNGTYGSPRMTRELQDQGLRVGRRRTARLMRENGLRARQPGASGAPPTACTPSQWRPTCSTKTFQPGGPTRSGARTSPTSGRERAGSTWQSSSTSMPGVSWAGRSATACTRSWRFAPCDEPSRCDDLPPACFTIRTAVANSALLPIRPSSGAMASGSQCRARGTATTTPWSRHSSRR